MLKFNIIFIKRKIKFICQLIITQGFVFKDIPLNSIIEYIIKFGNLRETITFHTLVFKWRKDGWMQNLTNKFMNKYLIKCLISN